MATDFHIQKRAMLEALEKSLGVVTTAAKTVGIDRTTHYKWLDSDAEYKAAVESISDIALDFAESKLHKSIENGSDTATIFYLKTKGKRRGYIERAELDTTHSFKDKPTINLILADGSKANDSSH